jgi:hypothetical protein
MAAGDISHEEWHQTADLGNVFFGVQVSKTKWTHLSFCLRCRRGETVDNMKLFSLTNHKTDAIPRSPAEDGTGLVPLSDRVAVTFALRNFLAADKHAPSQYPRYSGCSLIAPVVVHPHRLVI